MAKSAVTILFIINSAYSSIVLTKSVKFISDESCI